MTRVRLLAGDGRHGAQSVLVVVLAAAVLVVPTAFVVAPWFADLA